MSKTRNIGKRSSKAKENADGRPRKKNDELLKGVFEDNFGDFLRFVYPGVEEVIDFDKGIDFMDKELFAIISDRKRSKDKRESDLIAKLYLKDGTEKYFMLNVEIEGGDDIEFAYRMFQYSYRIRDRYCVSAAAIVVFVGDKRQARPTKYIDHVFGTTTSFEYLSYHIFNHNPKELLKMDNAFALIVLACQKALMEGKINEDELNEERLIIAKAIIDRNYEKHKVMSLVSFLKNFIYIKNKDINSKFDEEILKLTKGEIKMGVIEVLKMQERREGKLEGKLEGKREGKIEEVENLIVKLGLSDAKIAEVAQVSTDFVIQVRTRIEEAVNQAALNVI